MKVCVTGGLGFIGSELIKHLKSVNPLIEILCIDDISKLNTEKEGQVWFQDYKGMLHNDSFDVLKDVGFIFHLGANSSTRATEKELYPSNYAFTIKLLRIAQEWQIPVVFASSASVYGAKREGNKTAPQTNYAFLKLAIEKTIEELKYPLGSIISLRFHNVYGATETPKGNMASIVCKWIDDYHAGIKTHSLFYGSNEILRDFVHVKDVVGSLVTMYHYWGIHGQLPHHYTLDVGTGVAVSFEQVAKEIIKHTASAIQYCLNPYSYEDYQWFTQADISNFKEIHQSLYDCDYMPLDIEEGVKRVFHEKTILHNSGDYPHSASVAGV